MSAIKVFDGLVQRAYGIVSFFGDRLRRGKFESKPGELVERLSSEEREALQKLTVDDLNAAEPSPGMIALFAEVGTEADPEKWAENHIRQEKLKFDKTLDLPSQRQKKYEP
jgi:hypothetical protein